MRSGRHLAGIRTYMRSLLCAQVQGLNKNQDTLTVDFKTIVWRMKLLGFNAVRLPFSFQVGFTLPLQA